MEKSVFTRLLPLSRSEYIAVSNHHGRNHLHGKITLGVYFNAAVCVFRWVFVPDVTLGSVIDMATCIETTARPDPWTRHVLIIHDFLIIRQSILFDS
jgi:hypothetical protein